MGSLRILPLHSQSPTHPEFLISCLLGIWLGLGAESDVRPQLPGSETELPWAPPNLPPWR